MNRKRETNEVWGKEKRYCKKSDNNFYQSPLKTISKIAGIVRFILFKYKNMITYMYILKEWSSLCNNNDNKIRRTMI